MFAGSDTGFTVVGLALAMCRFLELLLLGSSPTGLSALIGLGQVFHLWSRGGALPRYSIKKGEGYIY